MCEYAGSRVRAGVCCVSEPARARVSVCAGVGTWGAERGGPQVLRINKYTDRGFFPFPPRLFSRLAPRKKKRDAGLPTREGIALKRTAKDK